MANESNKHLQWLKSELEYRFETKTQHFVHQNDFAWEGSINIFNRIVGETPSGSEVEADPRHLELIIEPLNYPIARSVAKEGVDGREDPWVMLVEEKVTAYRSMSHTPLIWLLIGPV